MTNIITHRGIDAEKRHLYSESSREAFEFFLKNDFGIEFDIQITQDNVPVISHDASLTRIAGKPYVPISQMNTTAFLNTPLTNGHALSLEELVELINRFTSFPDRTYHALHLKHYNQTKEEIDIILNTLASSLDIPLLIFDAKPDTARYIRSKKLNLVLGASVAHPFDIKRYNNLVGGTLLSLKELLDHKDIYDWAWLDEWDRIDADGAVKSLYTEETFALLRNKSFKITIVSPELHATSPYLLGGESHPDATSQHLLETRLVEILGMKPDAICTDYPVKVSLLSQHQI